MTEPDPYHDSFTRLVGARALTTATLLGVFDSLHEQPGSAEELADRLSLDPLGADTLLTTLLTLGYVEPAQGGALRNSAVSERLLVSSSPESIATFVGAQGDLHWQALALLPDAVRDGSAYAMHEERRDETERWEAYIRGLYEIYSMPACRPVSAARRGARGATCAACCASTSSSRSKPMSFARMTRRCRPSGMPSCWALPSIC